MNALLSMVRTGGDEIASLLINKQQNEGSKEGGRGALFFNEMILFLFFLLRFLQQTHYSFRSSESSLLNR